MDFEFSFDDFVTEMQDFTIRKVKKFDRLWRFGHGGSICFSYYYKGVVYFGACDDFVYALDADSGSLLWKFKTSGIIMAAPFVHENILFVASYDEYFYALNKENGKEIWKFRTGGKIFSTACVWKNFVYISSADSFLYCIDISTGKEIWRFKTGDEIASVPVVFEDKVFIGSYDSYFYCIKADTGQEIWRFKTGDQIQVNSKTTVVDRTIYFASFDNYLYAVNVDTGKEVWRFRTGKYGTTGPPTIHKNIIYHPTRDGIVYALNKNGKELWRFYAGGLVTKVGGAIDDMIYFGSEDGHFYALNTNGKEVWRFKAGGIVYDTQVDPENKRVFFGSWDCFMYAVDAKTGKELWRFQTSSSQQAYVPPPHDVFEAEIKIKRTKEDEKAGDSYTNITTEQEMFGEHFYTPHTEYKTKSEYR